MAPLHSAARRWQPIEPARLSVAIYNVCHSLALGSLDIGPTPPLFYPELLGVSLVLDR